MSTPRHLVDLLHRAASYDDRGLRFLDRRERATFYSWAELSREASRVAAGLRRLGIGRGERVALIFPTCVELIHGLFGCLQAGAVPVPLYPPIRLGRLDEYHPRTAAMLRAAGARLALVDSKVSKLLGTTCELARLPNGFLPLKRLMAGAPSQSERGPQEGHRETEIRPEDLALIQFSSGTTVSPKPVALSHGAILAQVRALNGFWPSQGDDLPTGVSWLPLYHDMGLIGCIFPAVELPSVLTLFGPEVFVARPAIWLRTLSRYRASISVAPNFAYGLCVDKIRDEELEGVDLGHWKVALNGSEPVAPEVLRAFQRRFARWGFRPEALTPVYGLSEATLAVTFSNLAEPFRSERFDRRALEQGVAEVDPSGRELISVGRPLTKTEIRIVGDSDRELKDGLIGRIQARGPSIMMGYLDRPEATAGVLRDGWLDTGDVGFIFDHELFIYGRAKDVLILRGRNYSPVDVEQAVDGVEGVRTGCSVAASYRPDGASTEILLLFVEVREEPDEGDRDALAEACRKAVLTACGLRIDKVVVLPPGTLPRTSSGKLRRSETLSRHLAGELDSPAAPGAVRLAGEIARSVMAYGRAEKARHREPGG